MEISVPKGKPSSPRTDRPIWRARPQGLNFNNPNAQARWRTARRAMIPLTIARARGWDSLVAAKAMAPAIRRAMPPPMKCRTASRVTSPGRFSGEGRGLSGGEIGDCPAGSAGVGTVP